MTLLMGRTFRVTENSDMSRTPETNSGRAMVASPKNEIAESAHLPAFTPARTPKKMETGT